MRAADAVRLNHPVGAFSTQTQIQVVVTNIVLNRFIRHRPFVHTKAPEECLLIGCVAQDFAGEREGGTAFVHELGYVHENRVTAFGMGVCIVGGEPG